MKLHTNLLKQAEFLARKEPKRPSQASLRRAVSASYYALFHLFVDEATRLMISGSRRASLRAVVARAFRHSTMRSVAYQFTLPVTDESPAKLVHALNAKTIQPALASIADTFMTLQKMREEADYSVSRRFTRSETLGLVNAAQQAFADWRSVRGTPQADVFLAGLLTYHSIPA